MIWLVGSGCLVVGILIGWVVTCAAFRVQMGPLLGKAKDMAWEMNVLNRQYDALLKINAANVDRSHIIAERMMSATSAGMKNGGCTQGFMDVIKTIIQEY